MIRKNLIILICNANKTLVKINNLLKLLREKKRQYLIVLSEATNNVNQLRDFYRLIVRSVDTCKKIGLWGVINLDDIKFHTASYGADKNPLYNLVKIKILEPLADYDKNYNSELIKTLYIFLHFNSFNQTAEFMNIHINTLRYRIDKVRNITGKNVTVANDYHELFWAMVIADLEGLTKCEWNISFFSDMKSEENK